MSGIIVVFPREQDAKAIKALLVRSGYANVSMCTTGSMAISIADRIGEGIIISGYRMPDMLYSEIHEETEDRFEMMVVASRNKLVEDDTGIAKLEMPIKVRDLLNSIEMMEETVLSRSDLKKKKPGERTALEQSTIDEAKAVLMETQNMSESDAHRYIQKNAMNTGKTMTEIAEIVLKIMYQE